jgi:hypothetical protein
MRRGIGSLTNGLVIGHAVGLLLRELGVGGFLALLPPLAFFMPWTLVTYQFFSPMTVLSVLFFVLILWYFGNAVEAEIGWRRYTLVWVAATLPPAIIALAIGTPLYGPFAFEGALLYVFARLFPDLSLHLFLILPVRGRALAFLGGGLVVYFALRTHGVEGGVLHALGMLLGSLTFQFSERLPSRRKLMFELKKKSAEMATAAESATVERRNATWDAMVRAAEQRARELGAVAEEDRELLVQLDEARDPDITVCAPEDFGYVDDAVCRTCSGYAECAARRIRLAAEDG